METNVSDVFNTSNVNNQCYKISESKILMNRDQILNRLFKRINNVWIIDTFSFRWKDGIFDCSNGKSITIMNLSQDEIYSLKSISDVMENDEVNKRVVEIMG